MLPQPTKVVPQGFAHHATLKLSTLWVTLGLNLSGLLLLLIWGWVFWRVGAWIHPQLTRPTLAVWALRAFVSWPILIAVMVSVLLLHEAVHGLFFWLYTKERPAFGLGLLYAYATAPDWYLPRNQFAVVALAPLLLISTAGVLCLPLLPLRRVLPLLVGLVINAAGAIGDLYVVARLLRQPRTALVRDEGATMRLFTPATDVVPILRQRWQKLLRGFGVADEQATTLFADLCAHYALRPYHNLDHILHLLQMADRFADSTGERGTLSALRLAIWYHDIIYDPRASDNEARSAVYAQEVLAGLVPPETISRIAILIEATTHHTAPADAVTRLLLDLDLSILAVNPNAYQRYQTAIRQEYAHVPDELYRRGRQQVLQTFLARERIFLTEALTPLEETARRNIRAEMAEPGRSTIPRT